MKKNSIYAGRGNLGFNALAAAGLALGIALIGSLHAGPTTPFKLLVADGGATVYSVDPQTGDKEIVSQGGHLARPFDLAVRRDGTIVVSDSFPPKIVLIDPVTRQQTVAAQGDDVLGTPYGLDVDRQNRIYIANGRSILRINPKNNRVETVATGGLLRVPMDVAVASDGGLYVADVVAGIIRVEPATHKQTLISSGGMLHTAIGITLDENGSAYVADAEGRCVVTVNLQSGDQHMVSMGGLFASPVGIVLTPDGTLLVSDPDAFDADGAIMTISPDGTQHQISRGYGDLVNARGIAIQPLTLVRQKLDQ